MGKKCIPGVICIENMTLFILIVIVVILVYLLSRHSASSSKEIIYVSSAAAKPPQSVPDLGRIDTFRDPYAPPLIEYPPEFSPVRLLATAASPPPVFAVPINQKTRGYDDDFQQMGILTRSSSRRTNKDIGAGLPFENSSKDDIILPFMGRKIMNARDKWQYYAISNTGTVNTKLPIRINGRDCMNEYGCDEIMDGDNIYVGGYNDSFRVTKYENNYLRYLPVL
jgi:hypothetical protein